MFAAIVMTLVIVVYRVVLGMAGTSEMGWLHNFCPLAAVALCGAAFLPSRIAFLLPLTALLVSDLALNAHYDVALLSLGMIPQYFALGMIAALGWLLRVNPRLPYLLLGSAGGSVFFYLITNTGAWVTDPLYSQSSIGWLQAMTTGLPQYQPPTWVFFRNSLVSDLLFTAIFFGCMALRHETRAVAAKPQGTAAW
jgi:hypothetical protein